MMAEQYRGRYGSARLGIVYARDWLYGHVDRFVDYWIRRASDRVHEGVERWLAENAERADGP